MGRHAPSKGLTEAKQALWESRLRRPEVDAVVKDLKRRRDENQFAESIRLAFEATRSTEKGEKGS